MKPEKSQHIKRGDQHVTTEQILDRLIKGTPRRKHPEEVPGESSSDDEGADNANLPEIPISPLSALGVGSDLDILIEFSHELDEVKKQEILGIATDFTNSAAKKFGLENASALKNSIVPTGDVNEYQAQIQESSSQGGSSLDWLAFPVQGGEMRMPNNHPKIMEYFFQGNIEYLSGEGQRDPDKQTIRGIRSLLEIPFLDLTPDGKEQLLKELRELHNKIERGDSLSPQALKQFNKMIRNARFEGAGNRFSRPRADDEIAQLISKISALASKNEKDIPLVPEFTQWEKIENRQIPDKAIDPWLMPVKEFHEQYTHNGKLYHGTPKIDYLLAMIRNGLIASIPEKQGMAACGAGFYTSPDLSIVREYTVGRGVVLELPVNKSKQLRVLDYEKFINTPEGKEAQKNAERAQQDINQYLAEHYHVDVIIRTHPLIMNVAAVQLPKKTEQLVQTKISTHLSNLPNFLKLTSKEHQEFYPYLELAQQLGINIGEEIGNKLYSYIQNFKEFFGYSFPKSIDEFLLLKNDENDKLDNHTEQVLSCLKLAKALNVQIPRDMFSGDLSQHVDTLLRNLNSRHASVFNNASYALKTISPNDREAIKKIATYFYNEENSNWWVLRAVIETLGQCKVDDPDTITKMVSCIKNKPWEVTSVAVSALRNIKLEDHPRSLLLLVEYLPDQRAKYNAVDLLGKTKLDAHPDVLQKLVTLFENSGKEIKGSVFSALKSTKLDSYPQIFEQFVETVKKMSYANMNDVSKENWDFIVSHEAASSDNLKFIVQNSYNLECIESVAKHRNCNDEVKETILSECINYCVKNRKNIPRLKDDVKIAVEHAAKLISKIKIPETDKIKAFKKIFEAVRAQDIALIEEIGDRPLKLIVENEIASSDDLKFVVQNSFNLECIESVAKHRNCNDDVRKAIVHRSGELCVTQLQDPAKLKADMKKVVEDTVQLISKIKIPETDKKKAFKKIFEAARAQDIALIKEIGDRPLKLIVENEIASSDDLKFVVQNSFNLEYIESVAKHQNCNDDVRKAIVCRSGELCVTQLQDSAKLKADMKKVVEDTAQLISKIDGPAPEKIDALKKIFDAMQDENIPLRKEKGKFMPSFFHKPQSYQEALKAVKEAVLTILNQSQPGELNDQKRKVAVTILSTHEERLGFGKTASQNKIAPQK